VVTRSSIVWSEDSWALITNKRKMGAHASMTTWELAIYYLPLMYGYDCLCSCTVEVEDRVHMRITINCYTFHHSSALSSQVFHFTHTHTHTTKIAIRVPNIQSVVSFKPPHSKGKYPPLSFICFSLSFSAKI